MKHVQMVWVELAQSVHNHTILLVPIYYSRNLLSNFCLTLCWRPRHHYLWLEWVQFTTIHHFGCPKISILGFCVFFNFKVGREGSCVPLLAQQWYRSWEVWQSLNYILFFFCKCICICCLIGNLVHFWKLLNCCVHAVFICIDYCELNELLTI